eukprot:1523119-Pyramimonas_sp.AAC.1
MAESHGESKPEVKADKVETISLKVKDQVWAKRASWWLDDSYVCTYRLQPVVLDWVWLPVWLRMQRDQNEVHFKVKLTTKLDKVLCVQSRLYVFPLARFLSCANPIRNGAGCVSYHTISALTRALRIFTAFCEKRGIAKENSRFVFDGKRLNGHQTPQDYDMEDEDCIEVFLEQVGGNVC